MVEEETGRWYRDKKRSNKELCTNLEHQTYLPDDIEKVHEEMYCILCTHFGNKNKFSLNKRQEIWQTTLRIDCWLVFNTLEGFFETRLAVISKLFLWHV